MFVVDSLPLKDKRLIFWVSQDIAHTCVRTGEHWLSYNIEALVYLCLQRAR